MEWMILPLKRYFEFSGRSRRQEYWMFVVFTILGSIILGVFDELLGLKWGESETFGENGVLGSIFSLATFIPSLTVAVRRLHDTDRSGWLLLVPFAVLVVGLFIVGATSAAAGGTTGMGVGMIAMVALAVVSLIALLVFLCLDGTSGPNRFGDDPKGVAYEGVFD